MWIMRRIIGKSQTKVKSAKKSLESSFGIPISCVDWNIPPIHLNSSICSISNAGVSRSVSAVIGYLMTAQSMGYQEAYDLVKQARTAAQPNEGFRRQLIAYEAQIKKNLVHKLQSPWTLWLENKLNKASYSESLRRLGTFSTVEGLWEYVQLENFF